jgi:hypothetical protein
MPFRHPGGGLRARRHRGHRHGQPEGRAPVRRARDAQGRAGEAAVLAASGVVDGVRPGS